MLFLEIFKMDFLKDNPSSSLHFKATISSCSPELHRQLCCSGLILGSRSDTMCTVLTAVLARFSPSHLVAHWRLVTCSHPWLTNYPLPIITCGAAPCQYSHQFSFSGSGFCWSPVASPVPGGDNDMGECWRSLPGTGSWPLHHNRHRSFCTHLCLISLVGGQRSWWLVFTRLHCRGWQLHNNAILWHWYSAGVSWPCAARRCRARTGRRV